MKMLSRAILSIVAVLLFGHAQARLPESPRGDSKSNSMERAPRYSGNSGKASHPALQTKQYKQDRAKIDAKYAANRHQVRQTTRSDLKNLPGGAKPGKRRKK